MSTLNIFKRIYKCSRSKFESITNPDSDSLYFIKNEHTFYKGSTPYSGVLSFSLEEDADGYQIITVIDENEGTVQFTTTSKSRTEEVISWLQEHIDTVATESDYGHVKVTTDIEYGDDNAVPTNITIRQYLEQYLQRSYIPYPSFGDFPVVGKDEVLYLAENTNALYRYDGAWIKVTPYEWDIISGNNRKNLE